MARTIDTQTVRHIGGLARLALSDAEVERYAAQLSAILDYMDELNRVDTTGVEPTTHPTPQADVLREDVPTEPLGAARVLANAPRAEAGYFALPKVLDSAGA